MNVGRRKIVDSIFEEALDLPPDAQSALLDRRCGADAALRHEVMELLRLSRASARDFGLPSDAFRQAAMKSAGHAPASAPHSRDTQEIHDTRDRTTEAGTHIGGWRVIREIGRGGMGAVYLVERAGAEFAQRGALKLVEGSGRAEDVHRRLERERRILASLSHPHIAQLIDGGRAADGRPYLVMEYVEGRHIDRFCDEERLTIDERLDLFSHVCAALQQAHRQLVVHRDVKPSNIIVTAERHPILVDFGIARLLSADQEHDGAATAPAARILTPDYASPEQVRGEPVAIASDVYQLGLLLYELLTGAQAQSIAGAAGAARAAGKAGADGVRAARSRTLEQSVCETEPIRPSVRARNLTPERYAARRTTPHALSRALRGDLDSIILCALRKEPERRYGSVADLLDDIDRHRRGAPLRAGAESLTYRARKFMARHRAGVAWASAGLIAAIALLVIVGGARMRAAREAAEARQMEKLLAELFTVPNRALTGRPPAALDYVRQAVELTRRQLAGQPQSQARLLTLLGQTSTNLGDYELSNEVLSQALALRVTTSGADSLETADALTVLAQGQHYLGRYDDAEASLRRALSIRRQRLGESDPSTVETTLNLGDLLHTRGHLADAETLLRGAVDILRKRREQTQNSEQPERSAQSRFSGLPGQGEPERPLFGRLADIDKLGRAVRDLGNVLRDRGLLEESEARYREALELLTKLHGESHVAVAETNAYFARLLVRRGKFDEADARLEHSLSSLRRSFGGDHPLTGTALRELGLLRIRQERFAEAERVLADAQDVFRVWVGEDHPMVPRARAHQAELALRRGNHLEAVRLARLTLDQFRRLRLDDHPSAIDARLTLGQALLSLGRTTEAERELAAGLTRARRHLSDEDPRIGEFRIGLTAAADARRRHAGTGAGATSDRSDRSGEA
jgi:serine/threonine protein kinase/tetratricopeptide (TPR) repeat protein